MSDTPLSIVDIAEQRGLSWNREHAELSSEDAKKIRSKVTASLHQWAEGGPNKLRPQSRPLSQGSRQPRKGKRIAAGKGSQQPRKGKRIAAA